MIKKNSHFRTDSEEELSLLQRLCKEQGAFDAVICSHWAHGGQGAVALAEAVVKAAEEPSNFKYSMFFMFCFVPYYSYIFSHFQNTIFICMYKSGLFYLLDYIRATNETMGLTFFFLRVAFQIFQITYSSLLTARFLYDLEQSIEEKIEIIAKEIYGADGIDISPAAQVQIDRYKAQVNFSFFRAEKVSKQISFIGFMFLGFQ